MSDAMPKRPTTNEDRDGWKAYWAAQGMPWRTEPEIDEERQEQLDTRRREIKPDIKQGIYPFKDLALTRADMEWLLATHEGGRGPVRWEQEKDKANDDQRWSLDLRGADLHDAHLLGLPLVGLRGGLTLREWIEATPAQREHAVINLVGADLRFGQLQGANLREARLQQAKLLTAELAGASLSAAHLEGADCRRASVDDKTDLSGVRLAPRTSLGWDRWLHRRPLRSALLGDILWGDVDLTRVHWGDLHRLGDEQEARSGRDQDEKRKDGATRSDEFEAAVRANRQLATRLRDQGMNDDADRFAYRAQVCQRSLYLRQFRLLRYLGSRCLALIAGYGYRPLRSLLTYACVVLGFAAVYIWLGGAGGRPLAWNEALVVSLTAFHGRGFFATAFQPGDPQAAVAAGEAVIGLLIEITFIATFTQRFFAR